jgi:sulfate permease, SulP family
VDRLQRQLTTETVVGTEPGHLIAKLFVLAKALPSLNANALAIGTGSAALIFALQRWRPHWPAMLIATAVASIAAFWMQFPVETIGTKFGGVPHGLPVPSLPAPTWPRLIEMLPTALSFTLLGGVESLLSAKIADGMTQRKHRYNMELLAQGIANVASAVFGGICVTGTIARTATNIRAGGRTPIAGMLHAVFLLVFLLIAAPLANYIPLSALAGVLLVVCWKMAEKEEFVHMLRRWPSALALLATFGLTLIEDLTVGIIAGCGTAALCAVFARYSRH